MNTLLSTMLMAGLACGVVSTTVTQSSLFRPLRTWVTSWRAPNADGSPWFLAELITCPYCFGHWVGIVCALYLHFVNPLIWFTIIAISVLTSGLITKLYD